MGLFFCAFSCLGVRRVASFAGGWVGLGGLVVFCGVCFVIDVAK